MTSDPDYIDDSMDIDSNKASRSKKSPAKKSSLKTASESSKTADKISAGRSQARDYSFKQRFILNYGYDEEFYQRCIVYKSFWEDKMFYPKEQTLQQSVERDSRVIEVFPGAKLYVDSIQLHKIDEAEFPSKFGFKGPSEIPLTLHQGNNDISTKLRFGEYLKVNDSISRNGLLLNVGGHITSMKWLPGHISPDKNHQYLAATIIKPKTGSSLVNNNSLSIFNQAALSGKQQSVFHGIQIWQYDVSQNHFSLYKFYLTEKLGICNNISWIPLDTQENGVLGYLCGTFAGKLNILKIDLNKDALPELAIIEKASLTYEIHDSKDPTLVITSYDYLGQNKLIVGLSNGSIAEFLLPTMERSTCQLEDDINIPSFIVSVTESLISNVAIGKRGNGLYTVIVNSVGSQCFALEYGDLQHGRVESWATNSFIKPIYNKNLKLFITDDGAETLQYSFIKHPSEKATIAMKVDGTITALHMSEVLNHPLALNGTSTGEINIINLARKILNGGKATNKTSVPLRLWKLSKIDDTLIINGDLTTEVVDRTSKQTVAPTDVIISALTWNESIEVSSLYTAATASGLIILERLDPDI